MLPEEQSGLPGRYIADPINFAQAAMQFAAYTNKPWMVLFLDFEKNIINFICFACSHAFPWHLSALFQLTSINIYWTPVAFPYAIFAYKIASIIECPGKKVHA